MDYGRFLFLPFIKQKVAETAKGKSKGFI